MPTRSDVNGCVILMRLDQITDAPNEKPCWGLASFALDDPMEFSDNTAISPFSIDDYHQPGTEGYYSSTDGSLGRASSMEEMGSRATSHISNSSRETPQSDIETADDAFVCSCRFLRRHANTKSNERFSRGNISAKTMLNS